MMKMRKPLRRCVRTVLPVMHSWERAPILGAGCRSLPTSKIVLRAHRQVLKGYAVLFLCSSMMASNRVLKVVP